MADKTKWDIDNENFNHFFHKVSSLMTEQQRESLPKDLYFKLFKRGGAYDSESGYKLSFLAKCFVLIKAFRKRLVIMVEDDAEGMDEEEFFNYKKLLSKRQFSVSGATGIIENSVFVLANKELFETHSRLNELCGSPAYNYLIKNKNAPVNKTAEHVAQMNYIARFLTHYESQRKRIHMNSGLNLSEWLVLTALYHGEEMQGSKIYNEIYKHSFNSSKTKKKVAFRTLEVRGYIQKFGISRGMKIRITPLGKNKVDEIMKKYIVNC